MKKAEGLSMQTIVVAAIVLVVLIIILAIFSNKLPASVSSLDSCELKTGHGCSTKCGDTEIEIKQTSCDKKCCLNLLTPKKVEYPLLGKSQDVSGTKDAKPITNR